MVFDGCSCGKKEEAPAPKKFLDELVRRRNTR